VGVKVPDVIKPGFPRWLLPTTEDGQNRPANEAFRIHPPGDTGLARCDDGITSILIAELPKHVIKLLIHLGIPGEL